MSSPPRRRPRVISQPSNDFRRAIYGINYFNFVLGMFVFGFSLSSLHLEIVPPQFWDQFTPLRVSTYAAVASSISVVVLAFVTISTIADSKSRSKTRLIVNLIVLSVVCVSSFCVGVANVMVAPKSFPLLGALKHNFCMNLFFEESGLINETIVDKWTAYNFNVTGQMADVRDKLEGAEIECQKKWSLNLMTFCGIILLVISIVLMGHLMVSYKTYKRLVEEERAAIEPKVRYVAKELSVRIST